MTICAGLEFSLPIFLKVVLRSIKSHSNQVSGGGEGLVRAGGVAGEGGGRFGDFEFLRRAYLFAGLICVVVLVRVFLGLAADFWCYQSHAKMKSFLRVSLPEFEKMQLKMGFYSLFWAL